MESNRLEILNLVQTGKISVEEGARLLNNLESEPVPQPVMILDDPVTQAVSPEELSDAGLKRYQNWWLYLLWLGVGFLVFSSGLMSWAVSTGRFFWFYCAWLPLIFGVAVIVFSAWSRNARWLHLRIQENSVEKSTNIKMSFPLPTGLAGWFFRNFGSSIPQLKEKGITEAILPLLDTLGNSREPVVVEVNEKDGEKVQVYIV